MNIYSISYFKHLLKVDSYLNKRYFKIGYSFKFKGPSFVWYRLSKGNILKPSLNPRGYFRSDKALPFKYRATNTDYLHSGYDKGHLASDSSFDFNVKALRSCYVLSNTVPQKHLLNAGSWLKAERYSRYLAIRLKYVYVFNIVIYSNDYIGDNVHIPKYIYKVIINNKYKLLKIFKFKETDTDYSLKNKLITLETLKEDIVSHM